MKNWWIFAVWDNTSIIILVYLNRVDFEISYLFDDVGFVVSVRPPTAVGEIGGNKGNSLDGFVDKIRSV